VPARLLVIEITESTIMAVPEHALQILGRLNQMGVQVSIDDFGTGYSSWPT
jgi:diguanylate cyclase